MELNEEDAGLSRLVVVKGGGGMQSKNTSPILFLI
jgi:hypothetical protein